MATSSFVIAPSGRIILGCYSHQMHCRRMVQVGLTCVSVAWAGCGDDDSPSNSAGASGASAGAAGQAGQAGHSGQNTGASGTGANSGAGGAAANGNGGTDDCPSTYFSMTGVIDSSEISSVDCKPAGQYVGQSMEWSELNIYSDFGLVAAMGDGGDAVTIEGTTTAAVVRLPAQGPMPLEFVCAEGKSLEYNASNKQYTLDLDQLGKLGVCNANAQGTASSTYTGNGDPLHLAIEGLVTDGPISVLSCSTTYCAYSFTINSHLGHLLVWFDDIGAATSWDVSINEALVIVPFEGRYLISCAIGAAGTLSLETKVDFSGVSVKYIANVTNLSIPLDCADATPVTGELQIIQGTRSP